jgi:hypothetical protein
MHRMVCVSHSVCMIFLVVYAGVPGAASLTPGTLASLRTLTDLDLSSVGLTVFPADCLQLSHTLVTLKLANNRINALPADVSHLPR